MTLASFTAARMLRMPAVKLSSTGVRPKACRAKRVTTPAELVGSRQPTRSPFLVNLAIRLPSANAARIRSV